MRMFLLFIFGIYGAVHVYAFLKARAAFPLGPFSGIILGVFMAAMTCAPILVRLLERHEYEIPARLLSYLGYSWMGVLFLFFSLSVLMDLYRLCLYACEVILRTDLALFRPAPRVAFLVPLFLALCLSLYGYLEALNIRPERITITTDKLPAESRSLRIVQISDVHLGLIVREARLNRIIDVIREANPDILVSTGDLVDGQINDLTALAQALQEVQPRYGKFAVTGNHEFYAGIEQALQFTRDAGFTVLRGQAVNVAGAVNLIGVDDPAGKRFGQAGGASEDDLLAGLPRDTFTVVLKHQPVLRQGSLGLYDLQLSGHTHRGQIFPFRLAVDLFFSHSAGWYDLPGGAHLYVSRGTGTWGPPIRFLSPPEVTIIDLVPQRRP